MCIISQKLGKLKFIFKDIISIEKIFLGIEMSIYKWFRTIILMKKVMKLHLELQAII